MASNVLVSNAKGIINIQEIGLSKRPKYYSGKPQSLQRKSLSLGVRVFRGDSDLTDFCGVFLQAQGGPKPSSLPNAIRDGFIFTQAEDLLPEQRSEVKTYCILCCVVSGVHSVLRTVAVWSEEASWRRPIQGVRII